MKIPHLLTAAALSIPALLVAQSPAQQGSPQAAPQNNPAGSTRRDPPIPPDDPALYRLFFGFYDGLIKSAETAQQKAPTAVGSPSAGANRMKGIAQLLKIEEGDVAKVTAVIVPSRAALVQLDSDRKSYAEQARAQHQQPDPAKLTAFDVQRRQLTDDTVQRLTASLSPASWKGLHSFINNGFREHTGTKRP